ncbi:MAG: branched-chain amino acid transaminase [Chloroflexota bacterium]|nr:MAG: branched-chain amino acid transaminase [Chloroflexota bacterium]
MLTEKPAAKPVSSGASGPARPATDPETSICFFEGAYVPLAEAKVSIMTHAFMYGTAVFEGIRAYWNEEQGQLYVLKLEEHLARIEKSCRILLMEPLPAPGVLQREVLEVVRRNGYREDIYIRPSFYKSSRTIGVRLHHLDFDHYILAVPFGDYIDTRRGVRVMTSSWRRNADESIPARGKIVGGYVNMAFQKSEAELNGFDEAIVLAADGHASEASAANLFVVRDGVLLTPSVNDDILEGITRLAMLELADAAGIPTEVRSIDRSELYVADEVFLCGTGVQVSAVVEVDHRPVGDGQVGPIASQLQALYFDAARGRLPQYASWLTPVY